jgi:pyruvate dehydrogenase E2 component (dihydrolipoamide acetyltransferase)
MEGQLVEQTRMRAGIARRMVASKQQAPHFYAQTEIRMDPLLAQLARLNETSLSTRITVTAVLVRGCVEALAANPIFNSVWTDDGLLQASEINLGIAIALDDGLLAPALLDAGRFTLTDAAPAIRDLAERATSRRLRPNELSDATFTLSNLGMFDISSFTAIITPPQVATLATARPTERWLIRDGQPICTQVMTATLSADHRAIDGIDAARFLETLKTALEAPELLLREPDPTAAKEETT